VRQVINIPAAVSSWVDRVITRHHWTRPRIARFEVLAAVLLSPLRFDAVRTLLREDSLLVPFPWLSKESVLICFEL
jgi:hypothetical protein